MEELEQLEKLLFKRFNNEIRQMKLKHKLEIESLKDRQAKLLNDLSIVAEDTPKIITSLCKAIKA